MKKLKKAKQAFTFYTRLHLQELTGYKARDLKGLLKGIKELSGSVIYHHTHRFLQQHQFLSPEPPNDFAYWVAEVLGEHKLGEELASVDVIQFSSIRALREKLIQTIENHIRYMENTGRGQFRVSGMEEQFHFIKTISFVFPTSYVVHNLLEFVESLKKVTINSIYFHVFEAKLRLEKSINDFSYWIDTNCGENELSKELARLDPYTYTLEGLRTKIINLIEKRIK
ncbi:MAG: hypothetical protein JSV30_01410 [Candidatus Omnitrophota bacterium]|nr:MAG: hypothetical protein JSV30_01410 [Candidatus Omnitrophota bacterium]